MMLMFIREKYTTPNLIKIYRQHTDKTVVPRGYKLYFLLNNISFGAFQVLDLTKTYFITPMIIIWQHYIHTYIYFIYLLEFYPKSFDLKEV